MNQRIARAKAKEWRLAFSRLIFAWGSVASAACYAFLTLLGRPPLIDDHLTVTAVSMLGCYATLRFLLDVWVARNEGRGRRGDRAA